MTPLAAKFAVSNKTTEQNLWEFAVELITRTPNSCVFVLKTAYVLVEFFVGTLVSRVLSYDIYHI